MARWIKPAGHLLYSSTCETTKSPQKAGLSADSAALLALPRVLVLLTRLLAGVLPLLALSRILAVLTWLLAGVLALLATALVALLVLLLFVGILFVCIASFSFAVAAEIGNATQQ